MSAGAGSPARRWRWLQRFGPALAALPAVLALGCLALVLLVGPTLPPAASGAVDVGSWREEIPQLVSSVAAMLVGAALAARRPSNPMGWLLCLLGVGFAAYPALLVLVAAWMPPGAAPSGAVLMLAWVAGWIWVLGHAGVLLILQLFPDGRPLSPRWRPLLRISVAVLVALAVASALYPQLEGVPGLANPIGVPAAAAVAVPLILSVLVLQVVAAGTLILRFARSRGEQRQQLKWMALGAGLLAASVPLSRVVGRWATDASAYLVLGAFVLAVTRYRLYEIDRLLNRTLVYALVSGLLLTVYVVAVTLLRALLAPVAGQSQLAVAVSTLVVAALFSPLRRAVQAAVDRRFNRARYDAAFTVAGYRARLQDSVDLDTVRVELLSAVAQSVQPQRASLWLHPGTPS